MARVLAGASIGFGIGARTALQNLADPSIRSVSVDRAIQVKYHSNIAIFMHPLKLIWFALDRSDCAETLTPCYSLVPFKRISLEGFCLFRMASSRVSFPHDNKL